MPDAVVLGGGISGQLIKMLEPGVLVLEGQPEPKEKLTRDYGANYLWREIPEFKTRSFQVITHVDGKEGSPESIRRYKNKIGKPEDNGNWGLQFQLTSYGYEILERPEVEVVYDWQVKEVDLKGKTVINEKGERVSYRSLVSTIPLPSLISLLGWDKDFPVDTTFSYSPIHVVVAPRPPDAPFPDEVMYVNYLSDPLVECYRFCDRFGERHYEGLTNMGRIPAKKLFPGKIRWTPTIAKILSRLDQYGIRCFGRYGKWSPDELLHETYKDIKEWIVSKD